MTTQHPKSPDLPDVHAHLRVYFPPPCLFPNADLATIDVWSHHVIHCLLVCPLDTATSALSDLLVALDGELFFSMLSRH